MRAPTGTITSQAAITTQSAGTSRAMRMGGRMSASPEESVEGALPLLLLVRAEQHRDHLPALELLHDAGRVARHVGARGQPAELHEERLAFLAEHEVGGKPRRIGMRRLRADADLAEKQRDRVERKIVGRAAREP